LAVLVASPQVTDAIGFDGMSQRSREVGAGGTQSYRLRESLLVKVE
jgi:hypothetical protein